MTPEFLAALEKPKRRTKAEMDAVRVGSAKDSDGRKEADIQAEIVTAVRALGFGCSYNLEGEVLKGLGTDDRIRMSARLRRLGAVWGKCDLSVTRPKSRGGPEYGELEIKRPGEILTTGEAGRIERLRREGFKAGTACSVDTALATLKEWQWL